LALGELTDPAGQLSAFGCAWHRISFAKAGPARTAAIDVWKSRWTAWRRMLPDSVAAIAVAYADWEVARSPQPLEIVRAAAAVGARGVLIDTFAKSSRDLLNCLSLANLQELVAIAGVDNLSLALAGSVTTRSLPLLLPLRPAIIAVRGAACDDGRLGRVCGSKVRNLSNIIRRCGGVNPYPLPI
jgi:hypothetical protein